MDLKELRKEIDSIDTQITNLFLRRMDVSARIGQYKKEHGLAVYDPARERQKLQEIAQSVPPEMRTYTDSLYSLLFELSRAHQRSLSTQESALEASIRQSLQNTPALFPNRPIVACQGVEGAFSQQACDKLFERPGILYFNSFDGVFAAVDKGLCQYGVLPLENSTAGSVNRIYDLMMKYHFHIVRSTRVKVDHCLLANPGAELSSIREIVSHEQALAQCADFLRTLGDVKITPCENTAKAAQMVQQSGRKDLAARSSQTCADLYGLVCLERSVQDRASNFTRFICISKNLEIYPGADKTSIMAVLPHRPGALYKVLSRFYALDINLIKLESRPLPNSDFEFMFYFDLEISVYSPRFLEVFRDLDGLCSQLKYLGSYSEVL